MRVRVLLPMIAALLLVAGSVAAEDSPFRGDGVITSVNNPNDASASSYAVGRYDKLTATSFSPGEDTVFCGATYEKGKTYPMMIVTSKKQTGVQALIVWEPNPGENPAPIEKAATYEITGLGGALYSANTLHKCGTVDLQWMPGGADPVQDVTVNLFNEGKGTGLFSYNTK